MCGICLRFCRKNPSNIDSNYVIDTERLQNRGPDICGDSTIELFDSYVAWLCGYSLQFQGPVTQQPIVSEKQNILLWNGEIFGGLAVPNDLNDGTFLLARLDECQNEEQILETFLLIEGPWAFIYWQRDKEKLWFGRDFFGRRSLVFNYQPENEELILSSVCLDLSIKWTELPANGIYCVQKNCENKLTTIHYPWAVNQSYPIKTCIGVNKDQQPSIDKQMFGEGLPVEQADISLVPNIATFNGSHPNSGCDFIEHQKESNLDAEDNITLKGASSNALDSNGEKSKEMDILKLATPDQMKLAEQLIDVLGKAVETRVKCQKNICHQCLQKRNHRTRRSSVCEVKAIEKQDDSQVDTSANDNSPFCKKETEINTKAVPSGAMQDLQMSEKIVSTASKQTDIRNSTSDETQEGESVIEQQDTASKNIQEETVMDEIEGSCGHARVAVLYSGGIDSLVIAALADRYVPKGEPIDLLNVAFEQQRKMPQKPPKKGVVSKDSTPAEQSHDLYNVPDRQTGKDGLKVLNASRNWNFVEVNVNKEELQEARDKYVRDLVYPLQTVLDDSIGCAIWFAARGQGTILRGSERVPYTSTARVVLVGMGADEQLAGYSRHRVKFNTGGWAGLIDEIKMEIERISSRNLGRDDRVIADHAKEARFPFLDENVVSFLNSIPVWQKANLTLPRGVGEKFLLRTAAVKLGLGAGAILPKRAIQFGSRIAKLENNKEKASDVCHRLQKEEELGK